MTTKENATANSTYNKIDMTTSKGQKLINDFVEIYFRFHNVFAINPSF